MTDVDDLNVDITNHPMWEVISQQDVPLGTDGVEINSHMDMDRVMRAMKMIDQDYQTEKEYMEEAIEFYTNRMNQRQNGFRYLRDKVAAHLEYLKDQGQKPSVATPAGTAYITARKSVSWPDEDTMLDFAKENKVPVKVKESVSKTDLKGFIESLEKKPDWYVETVNETVVLKFK